MSDCLFCKILAKEIPSVPIYEDADVYAFLDISPVQPGHTLVVPKKHSTGLLDADQETVKTVMAATQKIAQALKQGLGIEGLNIMQNEGAVAGQVIPHLHIHIIPRQVDDGLKLWVGKPASIEERTAIAEKIKI
jgi:histidine triad (HIT) family protein